MYSQIYNKRVSGRMKKEKTNTTAIKPSNALSGNEGKYVTKKEYISIMLVRIGNMFGTTLTGTLAAAFLYELYFAGFSNMPENILREKITHVAQIQSLISTALGIVLPLIAGIIVQKWKTRWGRYRQWFLIVMIPYFVLTVSFYWVPKGWTMEQMAWLRYGITAMQTVLGAFNSLSMNLIHVITPNSKEKKFIGTLWQISYYLGYGMAYLSPEIFKIFIPKNDPRYVNRYVILTIVAATFMIIGQLMCGLLCKERIELPKKEKTKLSSSMLQLFKYRNYRAYQYVSWAGIFRALGKWSTLLAGITVGSSNVILLTIPTAAGTVLGNVLCGVIAKKFEPTKILRFCGFYSLTASFVLFGLCYGEKVAGINFWEGKAAIAFYIFYFLFGVGIGLQELSSTHFSVEFNDYLEWQTGERMESVQGIIPGWINSALGLGKELLIPQILLWISYPVSNDESKELIDVVKERISLGTLTQNEHLNICMWLLALLVFGYAFAAMLITIILKFGYDMEGEKKVQMYKELEEMRKTRHEENEELKKAEAVTE